MRVGEQTLTVPQHGGVLVGPNHFAPGIQRHDVLWLIVGVPEEPALLRRRTVRPVAFLPSGPKAIATGAGRQGMAAEKLSGARGGSVTAIEFADRAQESIVTRT